MTCVHEGEGEGVASTSLARGDAACTLNRNHFIVAVDENMSDSAAAPPEFQTCLVRFLSPPASLPRLLNAFFERSSRVAARPPSTGQSRVVKPANLPGETVSLAGRGVTASRRAAAAITLTGRRARRRPRERWLPMACPLSRTARTGPDRTGLARTECCTGTDSRA